MAKSGITGVYVLYCYALAFYMGLGAWFNRQWGLPAMAVTQVVFLAGPAYAYAKYKRWNNLFYYYLPTFNQFLWVLLGTALLLALANHGLESLARYIPPPQSSQAFYQRLLEHKSWWVFGKKLLIIVMIPAAVEEFFFRGLIQGTFSRRFGKNWGLIISALLFAIAHFSTWYFPYFFVLGIFFAYLRNYSDDLSLCTMGHILVNLYALI